MTNMNIGGFTCPGCGMFVTGTAHSCMKPTAVDHGYQLIQALFAIRDELKRIADALEPDA